jgi:hypothetical protein
MAGKKKASKKVGKAKPKAPKAPETPEVPEVTVGEGEEVEVEVAIPEVASIKVRDAKFGVRMMTPSQFAEYSKKA